MNPLLLKAAPWIVAAGTLFTAKSCYDRNQREIGAMRERLKTVGDSLLLVKARGRVVDSVFRVDTVKLTRRIATTQTLIDTLLHSDTVTLTQRESVLVFVADSLVQQCKETVQSCTARISNLQTELALVSTQRDAYKRLQPSGFGKAMTTARDAAIGAALCYFLCPKR